MIFNAKTIGLMATGFCSMTLLSAMSRVAEPPVPSEPSASPTYEEVASIIANNCGYCHTGGADALGGISMDTEEEVVANAPKMFAAVDSGLMPYGDSEWRTTPDGILLLAYLRSQFPVESDKPEAPEIPEQPAPNAVK